MADVLLNNKPFVDAALGGGSKALQVLYDRRTQVVPLVIGLRQYIQTLTEVIRIDVGDGTLMAAVKGLLGAQVCGPLPCPGGPGTTPAAAAKASAPPKTPPATVAPSTPAAATGSGNGVTDLLRRVLGA